jgi:hypothetical protein
VAIDFWEYMMWGVVGMGIGVVEKKLHVQCIPFATSIMCTLQLKGLGCNTSLNTIEYLTTHASLPPSREGVGDSAR